MTDANDYPMYIDKRDAAVIEQLEKGDLVRVKTIRRYYKRYTDIRQDKTAKERKNALVDTPAFENVSIGVFRFLGVDTE